MTQPTAAKQASLQEQVLSFNRVFWTGNVMELIERLAYYGLRTVLPVYMVLSVAQGGPGFDHVQKGSIFAAWAAMQSFLPVFTGGYADRYGYKLTVGISVAVKISGYLVMAYAVDIASALTAGVSAETPGHATTYWVFLSGALLLAAGTAIFKPGIQGIIALQMKEGKDGNASTGWAIFYQLVNIGGFLGPFLAGIMRLLAWKWVFVSCAAVVALNYILLLTFSEPDKSEGQAASTDEEGVGFLGFLQTLWRSLIGICEPRLMAFLVIFSGFWMMFYQLFDLLPNFIDQWVDSSGVLAMVSPLITMFGEVPEEWGGRLPQEFMININAGMIMLLAFLFGYVTGKMRSMTAMVIGILVSALAIWSFAFSPNGWYVLGGIALFSAGEMLASPTKLRYFSSIAPPGKKGMYLGYANATTGIGWSIGSIIAGAIYQEHGDKVVLARKHLIELGQSEEVVDAIPRDDVLPELAERIGTEGWETTVFLWNTYDPGAIWNWFALVGVVSMVGLILFDQVTRRDLGKAEVPALIGLTFGISSITYGWTWALAFSLAMILYASLQSAAPQVLPQGAGSGED